MSMIGLGIAAIDVVFAVALLAIVSCLAYLVYLTVRERGVSERGRALKQRRTARSDARVVALPSLRPSTARHRHAASS
jgi:hypothetical protein